MIPTLPVVPELLLLSLLAMFCALFMSLGRQDRLDRMWRKWFELRRAVYRVYFAAHWTPDRTVPHLHRLWEELRDRAELPRGCSPKPLPPDQMGARTAIRLRAILDEPIGPMQPTPTPVGVVSRYVEWR